MINRCPFYDRATRVEVSGQSIEVRPFQIVLWASLRVLGGLSTRFPVILDTGHSLNFSIREEHLISWAGVAPSDFQEIGHTTLNQKPVLLYRCDLRLHPNVRGERDRLRAVEPEELTLAEGMVIHRAGDPFGPRLPLLGLRALARNKLKTVIDGKRLRVSISRARFW
jgi:hypothetical protein